jgi:hypothetical protein
MWSSLLPTAIIEAALLDMPQLEGAGELNAVLLCIAGGSAFLFPAAAPWLPASDPRTLDANPWIAVQLPPKEPNRLPDDPGAMFLLCEPAVLGLSAGFVLEG